MRFFVVVMLLGMLTASAFADSPRVAVFSQPGFPFYGPTSLTSPQAIARDLEQAGLRADLLDVAALADPAKMNRQNYAAVVLPYGNTYPLEAFANLKAFHQAGGSLILSGIPFTHGVARAKGDDGKDVWKDVGGEAGGFGPDGIGVGVYGDNSTHPVTAAPDDSFMLKGRDWPGRAQVLDVSSLPKTDTVTPVLVSGGQTIAALIAHQGDGFSGAVDAWTNYPHPSDIVLDAYLAQQMMERGTFAALAAKGALAHAAALKGFAVIDRQPGPRVFAGLTLPDPPRLYPTLQPKSPPPARHLYVADVHALPHDQQLLLASLQGIVNRKQPRIYLIWSDDDKFWLTVMQQQGSTDKPVTVADPLSLLKTFGSAYKGVVVPDPNVYVSPDIAVDIAGADDLLLATPELAAQLHLPIQTDLRGKFKDDADALHYARTVLLPRLNPYLALCLDPPLLGAQVDDVIAAKGMAFWVTGPKAQDKPGANMAAEQAEIEATFAQMPLNAVVRGYWWHGDDMGLGEGGGVSLGSRFGKITTVSDYVANYSVLSGVVLPALKQKPQPPAPKLDPTKVYLALAMSDGDNLSTWRGVWRGFFTDPLHGTFPVAYGMGPTLLDIAPTMAQWYYDHAAPTDEFLCDVSGAGYIYPHDWASALKDRPAAFRSYYDWTQSYMKRLDMKAIRIMGVGTEDIARAGADMPDVSLLMPDYGPQGGKSYADFTYRLPTGQPVFRAVSYGPQAEQLANEVRRHVGTTRPAFVNAFVFLWGAKLSSLKAMLDALGPDYVAVTPSQLNALYRQSLNK